MFANVIAVGAGGALGSIVRYLIGVAAFSLPGGERLPYGTFAVNVIGCFLIGILAGLVEARDAFSPEFRLFLVVGFLGGFTTFSAFGYETIQMVRGSDGWLALANVTVQVFLGVVAAGVGLWLTGGR